MGVNANSTVMPWPRGGLGWLVLGLVLATIAWLLSRDEYTPLDDVELEVHRESPPGGQALEVEPPPFANDP